MTLSAPLEDAASDCLAALAGVDTFDVNLKDHPAAWAAIEAFAVKVRDAERATWQGRCAGKRHDGCMYLMQCGSVCNKCGHSDV